MRIILRASLGGKSNQICLKSRVKQVAEPPTLGKSPLHLSCTACKELPMNPVQREILVIDGDEGARALIEQALVEQGFTVTAVGDGSAALRRIEAKPFALVVAEIRLPGPLGGTTTIRQARERQPELKCLFTSRFAPAPLWHNVELDDFIAKPFHRRELLGCVFELLQRDPAAGDLAADLEYSMHWPGANPRHCGVRPAGISHAAVAHHSRTD